MPKIHRDGRITDKTDVSEPAVDAPEMPNRSDVKAAWVAYAEAVGFDPSGLTKTEIIDAVG